MNLAVCVGGVRSPRAQKAQLGPCEASWALEDLTSSAPASRKACDVCASNTVKSSMLQFVLHIRRVYPTQ